MASLTSSYCLKEEGGERETERKEGVGLRKKERKKERKKTRREQRGIGTREREEGE
jgi:hypothetical protein